MGKKPCSQEGCVAPSLARGLCHPHYDKAKRRNALPPLVRRCYTHPNAPCLVTGCVNPPKAYGLCQTHHQRKRAGWPDWDTRPIVTGRRYGKFTPATDTDQQRDKDRRWAYQLKKNFGITVDEYNTLLINQGGLCAICHRECPTGRRLAVDHDHSTGIIRGLLCTNCNTAIGSMSDSPERLIKAAEYLLLKGAPE